MFHDARILPWKSLKPSRINRAVSQVAVKGKIMYWKRELNSSSLITFCIPQSGVEKVVKSVHPGFSKNIRRIVRHEAGGVVKARKRKGDDAALAVTIEFKEDFGGQCIVSIDGRNEDNWDIWMTARTLFEAVLDRLDVEFLKADPVFH